MTAPTFNIGTAGWTIPRSIAPEFPSEGSSLERYATRFRVAEINSSFHRPHRHQTWERWRDSVPADFRFAVKLPKSVTHQAKLVDCAEPLAQFLEEAHLLGDKLSVLLVQLPPKLAFDNAVASEFFRDLTARACARIVCEPRNASWFTDDADASLAALQVARVAADPALDETAARPGGWRGLSYWRLHGSPVMYRSSYGDRIPALADEILGDSAPERWCIFDNTASSAAAADAIGLHRHIASLE